MGYASSQAWEGPQGISLVAVVPPLGVLCRVGVLSTCDIGGSSLVFRLLLHCSCEGPLLIYFWGLISICSRGAPLQAQCARGLLSSSDKGILSSFDGNSSVFVIEGSFLVMALGSCQDALGDPGSHWSFHR